jgi:hypothetical protein
MLLHYIPGANTAKRVCTAVVAPAHLVLQGTFQRRLVQALVQLALQVTTPHRVRLRALHVLLDTSPL